MFYKLENPETSKKYRAYLDLLRVCLWKIITKRIFVS